MALLERQPPASTYTTYIGGVPHTVVSVSGEKPSTLKTTATPGGAGAISTTTKFTAATPPTVITQAPLGGTYNGLLDSPTTVSQSSTSGADKIETLYIFTAAVCFTGAAGVPAPWCATPGAEPNITSSSTEITSSESRDVSISTAASTGSQTSASGTSSPQSQAAAASSGGAKGLEAGAAAGAAIGAAAVAALVTFLITFFLCVKKRPKYKPSNENGIFVTEKAPPRHPWEAFLPQSADDGTVQRSVEALYSQIDMHVENYYSSSALAVISDDARASLSKAGTAILATSVASIMAETTTPLPVIKHCFSWMILSRLVPASRPQDSLLPAEFARLPAQQGPSKGWTDREEKAMVEAYRYWRVLTAHLMYPGRKAATAGNDLHSRGGQEVAETLTAAFRPWAKSVKGGVTAHEHLHSVLRAATETGLLIVSQPSAFNFEWDVLDHARAPAGAAGNTIVTLPAFEKTTDERGEALVKRQLLVMPKTEDIA